MIWHIRKIWLWSTLKETRCCSPFWIITLCICKLSQSPIQKTVEFVQNEDRVTQIFTDNTTDDCNQITYQKKDNYLQSNRRSQMCVNASTTAFARIYLHQCLTKLQSSGIEPLYCDTGKYSYYQMVRRLLIHLFFQIQ